MLSVAVLLTKMQLLFKKQVCTYFIRVGFNRKCNVLMTIKDVVKKEEILENTKR